MVFNTENCYLNISTKWVVFLCFLFFILVFLEEREIKVEQKYIFNPVFNKSEVRNSNWDDLRWVKCQILNHR